MRAPVWNRGARNLPWPHSGRALKRGRTFPSPPQLLPWRRRRRQSRSRPGSSGAQTVSRPGSVQPHREERRGSRVRSLRLLRLESRLTVENFGDAGEEGGAGALVAAVDDGAQLAEAVAAGLGDRGRAQGVGDGLAALVNPQDDAPPGAAARGGDEFREALGRGGAAALRAAIGLQSEEPLPDGGLPILILPREGG